MGVTDQLEGKVGGGEKEREKKVFRDKSSSTTSTIMIDIANEVDQLLFS